MQVPRDTPSSPLLAGSGRCITPRRRYRSQVQADRIVDATDERAEDTISVLWRRPANGRADNSGRGW
jgi:hypothetical protein